MNENMEPTLTAAVKEWLGLLKDIPGAGRAIARVVTNGGDALGAWLMS